MRKKLIEVALPLEVINQESSLRKRKAPRGYPTTLHKWWAQRPIAACRAVLFASLVDDPSSRPDEFPTDQLQTEERQRLFDLIEMLVKWENSTDEAILKEARQEILKATGGKSTVIVDPFCGAGSIPLEAQRLGFRVEASDLNPVAVLITKSLVEIPARFANRPPVNPDWRKGFPSGKKWTGAAGIATDVRYYGRWMRDEAKRRIGHYYPKVLSDSGEATVIAWLWARTVKCPNPACGGEMPLLRSFALSTKAGSEMRLEPMIAERHVEFVVRPGRGGVGTKLRGRSVCLLCNATVKDAELRAIARSSLKKQLVAIVAEAKNRRVYIDASKQHVPEIAAPDTPWLDHAMPRNPRWFSPPMYGLSTYRDLFTSRQLTALTVLSDLVGSVRLRIIKDMRDTSSYVGDASAYADAIATYLAFAVDRAADYGNTISTWRPKDNAMRACFSKQAIAMTWDFAEGNPFASSSSGFVECCDVVASVVDVLPAYPPAIVEQLDATSTRAADKTAVVCTDPPYYDNIGYADLSDFFYAWLRHSLSAVYPDLFSTILVPKSQELVATPYRFDGEQQAADKFFEDGLRKAFARIAARQSSEVPFTVFYAFRQEEDDEPGSARASTGWEMMLQALIDTGFAIHGTWPMRTEGDNRQIGIAANALASSILLVCRRQSPQARVATRREYINALKEDLPTALWHLRRSNIAPVDLAQAAIGPGMAVFTRFAGVIEADGARMRARSALQLINQALDEILSEQQNEYDRDTQWAIAWFEQFGMREAPYGEAETLSTAKDTSVRGLEDAGILRSGKGKVQLLGRDQLDSSWDPATDKRVTIWEVAQHLIRRLQTGGESSAAELLRKVGGMGEIARDLAYRLYSICERKGWADEAIHYNSLVVAWPEISRLASDAQQATPAQGALL